MSDIATTAERLADDLLFPRALETDRAEAVPVELLDALAAAGLYGLSGPGPAGGLDGGLRHPSAPSSKRRPPAA